MYKAYIIHRKIAFMIAALVVGLIYYTTQDDKETENAYKNIIGKKD